MFSYEAFSEATIRWRPSQKRRAAGHNWQHVISRRLRVLPMCPGWLGLSPGLPSPAEAGLWQLTQGTAATMLDHSRHRGESATKTVKFFAAHTVNCVICKNLTRIEWMLLNFTPVIQQNCHQPGRNFEKSILRSWQVELSKSETSDLVFDRKWCACNLLTWGLNVVLRYLKSSDFCVAEILWASNVPESSWCWQHHSNYQITTRLFHILQDIPFVFMGDRYSCEMCWCLMMYI